MPEDAFLESLPHRIAFPDPEATPDETADWLAGRAEVIEAALAEAGAVLIRGGPTLGAEDFDRICRTLTPDLLGYVGGGSPRTPLGGRVYTSTEYASSARILLHIEGAYLPSLPRRVWFHCALPAADRGATPLGDMRRVRARLDPALVERFRERGVLYVTNLHGGKGFGKSWRQTYETEDRAEVERILEARGEAYEWTDGDMLRVRMRGPVLRPHSRTGEEIWVNQAVNWHPAHLGAEVWSRMLRTFGDPLSFPKMAFFGDGGAIDPEDVFAVAAALDAEETVFDWRAGDLLLIDNEVVAHGRQPFTGARRVMVALA